VGRGGHNGLYTVTAMVSAVNGPACATETITCTPEHPLHVQGQGWVEAGSVGIGSSIVSRAGPALAVTALTWQKDKAEELAAGSAGASFGGYTVYNLTVEEDHTFFVGTTGGGTWVHNSGCAPENVFPGVHQPKQLMHDPTASEWRPVEPRSGNPTTPFDPRELPSGKTVDGALEDAWNNPIAGRPPKGQLFGKPGYPLNAAGDMYLEMRVGKNGVHGWPVSAPY